MANLNTNDLFGGFPLVNYNGQTAINITKSVGIVANLVSNGSVLTPYVVNQSIRSDQLAKNLYGDQKLEWLIWMSNGITDPFDWYMDQNQFYSYLCNKYGDYTVIQEQVAYYLNNWYDSAGLTVSGFNALPPQLNRYYEPTYNAGQVITGYTRRQVDWTIATNHIVMYNFSNSVTVGQFTNNEIVNITYDSLGNTSTGQVCFCNTSLNQLNIQHVSGAYNYANTINTAAFSIVGTQSNVKITIAAANNMTRNYFDTFPEGNDSIEYTMYDAVTIFDSENFQNENKKYLYNLGAGYVPQALTELKRAFLNGR